VVEHETDSGYLALWTPGMTTLRSRSLRWCWLCRAGALILPDRRRGIAFSAAGSLAIAAMFVFVAFGTGMPDHDPNIGARVLLFELIGSFGLLAAQVVRAALHLTKTKGRRSVASPADD
jgi:hypothetical protein